MVILRFYFTDCPQLRTTIQQPPRTILCDLGLTQREHSTYADYYNYMSSTYKVYHYMQYNGALPQPTSIVSTPNRLITFAT